MKIGLDAKRAFHNYTGLGNYSRNIIRCLLQEYPQHEYYLFSPSIKNTDFFNEVASLPNVKIIQPKAKLFTSLWRSYRITKLINQFGLDVYHGLSNELPNNIRKTNAKKIVTIHDLIPFKEDVFRNVLEDFIYKSKLHAAIRNAGTIVPISKATMAEIVERFSIDERRISLVYPPVVAKNTDHYADEMLEVKNKYQLPSNYLLQVGTVEYRKNIQIILQALKQMNNVDLHYVVVGRKQRFARSLIDFAKNSGLGHQVLFIDPLKDDELACMYMQAKAVVYPSLYEGFGLPIVESLLFGKPVLTTKGSCFEEAGGPGAYYCNTNLVEEVANTIAKMLSSNNTQMIEAGQHHVAQFNFKSTADSLMKVYST